MHLIVGMLSFIGVAVLGFIGHVAAHDFCERAPALTRWLLSFAIRWLPPNSRERYAEEWAAHLADCESVSAKVHHALGCLWCARRMRRQEFKGMTLRVTFNLPGIGTAVVRTNVYEIGILIWLHEVFSHTKPTSYLYVGTLTTVFWRRVYVDARKRNGITAQNFMLFLKDTKKDDWIPTAIHLTLNGRTINLIRLLRACGHSLKAMLEHMVKVLSPKAVP